MDNEFIAGKLRKGALEELLINVDGNFRLDRSRPTIKKVIVEGSRDRYEITYNKMWEEFSMVNKRTNGYPASIEIYFEGAYPLVENLSLRAEPKTGLVKSINGFRCSEGTISDAETMLDELSKSMYFQTSLGNFYLTSDRLYGDKSIVELLLVTPKVSSPEHKKEHSTPQAQYVSRIGISGARFVITDTSSLEERFDDEKRYKHTEVGTELGLGVRVLADAMIAKGFTSQRLSGMAGRCFGFFGKEYKTFFKGISVEEQGKIESQKHELVVVVPGKRAFEFGSRIFQGIQKSVEQIDTLLKDHEHLESFYLGQNPTGIGWILEAPHDTRNYLDSTGNKEYIELKGKLLL